MKENKFVKPARYCFQYIKNHCSKNINLNHTKKNTPKSLYQKSFELCILTFYHNNYKYIQQQLVYDNK